VHQELSSEDGQNSGAYEYPDYPRASHEASRKEANENAME
jgi:hypothetical protein